MKALCLALTVAIGCTPKPGTVADDDDDDDNTGDDVGDDTGPDAGGDCVVPGDPFAVAELERGVSYLASDELGGRASNTAGDRATRAFIADAFRCAGLVPAGTDEYDQPFVAPDGTHAANVVGYVPGTDPGLAGEVIIMGAHHDHLGTQAGQIYNGANDNASGTIALIAAARAIAAHPLARTVGFVAFGYEEHDGNCEGSEYFAAHAPAALAMNQVAYMVNYDMVGTYPRAGEVTVYGTLAGTRGRAIVDGLAGSYPDLDLAHSGNADTDDSDFQAFADRGVPYVYFETWDDACYHQPCDDADRIDYASMAEIAELGRDVVAGLAAP